MSKMFVFLFTMTCLWAFSRINTRSSISPLKKKKKKKTSGLIDSYYKLACNKEKFKNKMYEETC
jgi:hypothetical protein